mgnify:CR=1 FL=1
MIITGAKAIASYLGRDVRTVRRWVREHGLPVTRLHGKVRADKRAIDRWLAASERPAVEAMLPKCPIVSAHVEQQA